MHEILGSLGPSPRRLCMGTLFLCNSQALSAGLSPFDLEYPHLTPPPTQAARFRFFVLTPLSHTPHVRQRAIQRLVSAKPQGEPQPVTRTKKPLSGPSPPLLQLGHAPKLAHYEDQLNKVYCTMIAEIQNIALCRSWHRVVPKCRIDDRELPKSSRGSREEGQHTRPSTDDFDGSARRGSSEGLRGMGRSRGQID
jgi:hypothetical protein